MYGVPETPRVRAPSPVGGRYRSGMAIVSNTLPIFGGPAEGIHITTHDLSLLATHGSSFA